MASSEFHLTSRFRLEACRNSTDWQELMCGHVRAWKSQAVVGRDPDQLACRSQATRKWPSNHTPAFATPGLLGSGYRKAWISEPKHTGRGKVAREVFGRVRTSEASAKQQRDSQPFHAACSRLRCCYSLGTRATLASQGASVAVVLSPSTLRNFGIKTHCVYG